jgi:hypothetical protein
MGSKRIGLARVEALLENLKRDIKFGSGTTFSGGDVAATMNVQRLHPQWNCNFGGLLAGEDPSTSAANLLTPGITALQLSKALEDIANATGAPTAAQASSIFGGTGVAGVDVAIGTTGSPGTTPTVTQRVSRLTGDISGTVVMAAGADMTGANDETLILFTGNTFASSGVLKLTLAADNELQAASCEIWVTADGTDVLTRQTAASDDDQIIILTDTGDCTILAGSYIYLHADDASDDMQCKAVIRTSGGTVAVTYGN